MTSRDEDGNSEEQPEQSEPEQSETASEDAKPSGGDASGRNGSLESEKAADSERIDETDTSDEPDDAKQKPSDDDGAWYEGIDYGRRVVFPGLTIVCLVVILILFHKILLPFVFACALVYLMEPIVVRLSRTPEDPRGLPRWITVILVYLVFFGVVTVSAVLVMPRFVSEVVRFAETVPQGITKFREKSVPRLNERLQKYLSAVVPSEAPGGEMEEVKEKIDQAREKAAARAVAFDSARLAVGRATRLESAWAYHPDGRRTRTFQPRGPPYWRAGAHTVPRRQGSWGSSSDGAEPTFRIVESEDRGFEVFLNSEAVEIAEVGEKRWAVRRATSENPNAGGAQIEGQFDLEERLNHVIESAITFSNEQLASFIEFVRHLIFGIIEAFVAIILTLMVAAFISIDLPRFMGFFRSLVPDDLRGGYDELLMRVDEGLSGVIRGQLIICVINGIFTYIGLAILSVKFSVLLAVVAGVFSIIPVFGTVISTIPICLIALTQGFTTGLLVLAWILGIHFIEGNILNPKIIGTSAEIHPVIVIFALLAGESTYGLVGAILGVPVASIFLSLFKFIRDKVWKESGEGHVEVEKSLNQT